jgi:probable phosphoglycerate mutase
MGRSQDLPVLDNQIGKFQERVRRVFPEGIEESVQIFSSPAGRCQQTAEVLRDVLDLDIEISVLEEFDETDYGKFEGLHPKKIKKQWPDIYRMWMNAPSQVTFPGGESFWEVQERSYSKIQELAHTLPEENLFVITHVDVIKMIISKILSIPINNKRYFCIDPGSFSRLESDEGELKVKYLNRT